jgi:hypothetical protein
VAPTPFVNKMKLVKWLPVVSVFTKAAKDLIRIEAREKGILSHCTSNKGV